MIYKGRGKKAEQDHIAAYTQPGDDPDYVAFIRVRAKVMRDELDNADDNNERQNAAQYAHPRVGGGRVVMGSDTAPFGVRYRAAFWTVFTVLAVPICSLLIYLTFNP